MLYIFVIIGFCLAIGAFVSFCEDEGLSGFILLVGALAIGIASICGISSIDDRIDTYETLEETQEMVAIQDNSQVTGSGNAFYLSINTEGIYTFYYQLDDGGYRQGQVSAEDTIIYEEDNCENPSVQRYESYTQNNWSETWTKILLFSSKQDKWKYGSTRYEIHVPKGTIVQDFTLDAET